MSEEQHNRRQADRRGNWTTRVQTYIAIAIFMSSIIGGVYGFTQWINSKYASTDRLAEYSASVGMSMYDHRIIDLRDERRYYLINEPEKVKKIKAIEERIAELREDRLYFLKTGHYTIGDNIIISTGVIKELSNDK